jgi:hypothetical protein
VLFLVVPLFVWIALPRLRRVDLRAAVIFSAAVVAACGLWFGKNWVQADNPTYPLLYGAFGGKSWNAEQDARWTKAHGPPLDADGRAYSLRQSMDSLKVLLLTSDCLSPALWPLVLMAVLAGRYRPPLLACVALIVWTVAAWWLLTHRVDRFLVPLLPLAALLAGVGAVWPKSVARRPVVAAVLVGSSAFNFVFDASVVSDSRFLVPLAELPSDPRAVNPAHIFLNDHVQPGYRALMVGEAQIWDLAVPVIYNTCFDDCQFELLMRNRSRDERLAALRDNRISHIYFSWHELDRYRSPGNYGYSDYVTRELVRGELAREQCLIRRVILDTSSGDTLHEESGELYEVNGWNAWE